MLELSCKEVVFHFNKKHLQDPTVPMWVLKAKGETYYVSHVECSVPWSTKETPDNPHTKGSIKVKNCLLTIDDNNSATLSELTKEVDAKDSVRVISSYVGDLEDELRKRKIEHGKFHYIEGSCGTEFVITDILKKSQFTMLALAMNDTDLRILMPNEEYYKQYDNPVGEIYEFKRKNIVSVYWTAISTNISKRIKEVWNTALAFPKNWRSLRN